MTIDADGQARPPILRADLWCADCAAEHRNNPGNLGEVYTVADRVLFLANDPRNLQRHRRQRRHDPTWKGGYGRATRTDGVRPSDSLPAWCRHHGEGRVAGYDILGWRSNIVVKLRSARA